MSLPPDVRPGDPLRADHENALRAEVRRLGSLRGGPGVRVRSGPGGFSVGAIEPGRLIWIKLTGSYSAPGYAWAEMERSGSTWVATGTVGTVALDPAIEQNGDATLTSGDRRYPAWRSESSGELIFLKV